MGALEVALQLIEKADPQGTLPKCGIKDIEIGPGALLRVNYITQKYIPTGAEIAFVIDNKLILRDKVDTKKAIIELLSLNYKVRIVELDDGNLELHASEEVIAQSAKAATGVVGIVSVGGGTITDIGKMTSVALGGIPHIAMQTAASVDGYTDNVSVILINGAKRTVPSRWPEAVIADTTLIAEAPELLNRAGYGEINSMFTAPADWRLAALLGFEPNFHWGPIELLQGVSEGIESWAPGLAHSEIASIEKLTNALAVRGIVTGVANTTACLSGIEHLVSHMLDMYQTSQHKPIGQHGAQVGVGSLYAAAVWELIFAKFKDAAITPQAISDTSKLKTKVYRIFEKLDPTGALSSECWSDYEKKIVKWNSNLDNIAVILESWSNYKDELRSLIKTPEEIVQGLVSSGSSVNFSDLNPRISDETGKWAVIHSHLMRNRFVGLDLLEFLDMWGNQEHDWVFNRAERAITSVGVVA